MLAKRLMKVGAMLVLSVALGLPRFVRAEAIQNFAVKADLETSRRLTIEETIDYDFGTLGRYGILRSIPERYKRYLLTYDLHYTVEHITLDGKPVPWEAEDQGADLVLRIGDPVKYVTGTHRYVIRYRTDRAINDFSKTRELYWNVTGNEWLVSIGKASFFFQGPMVQRQSCFTGPRGSDVSACAFRPSNDSGLVVADSPARLDSHEGLTVVLEFPKAALADEPVFTTLRYLISDNFFTLLPVLLSLVMIGIWYIWGRDPRGRGVIIPQYEPPEDLTPALMASLQMQEVSTKAISGTILDLARRGFTKLELVGSNPEEPDKVMYTRLAGATGTLVAYEDELLKSIFQGGQIEVNLRRAPSQSQWQGYQRVIASVADDMLARGWFMKNPGVVRGTWTTLAFFIAVFAFIVGLTSYLLVALVVGVFGWYMPKVTPKGAEMNERVLGFKHFLSVTEKDRLAFSDAPAKRPEQFAEFLPAAVALGVEKEWAKQFEGMLIAPPSYIHGTGAHWGSLAYVHAWSHVSHSVAASMAHQTKSGSGGSGFSSGGGFSGGGFGGGGGGSW